MDINAIIEGLRNPRAYPYSVLDIAIHQTHISVVAVAGEFVYKIKKPVELGFLDFRSLEDRRKYCVEEVRINRRLAPYVYLGVVPICVGEDGELEIEGDGEPVEFAVKMLHLPDEATLAARLERGVLDAATMWRVGQRLARFHAEAERSEHISAAARYEKIAFNHQENFLQTRKDIGCCVPDDLYDEVAARAMHELERRRPLIEARAERRVACDGHGDLRLEHIYAFENRPPPEDLIALDGIEFNERFRHADPIADISFAVMELLDAGRRDLADALLDGWSHTSGDLEGLALLPLYTSYRAVVRAKVEGMLSDEEEVPARDRLLAQARASRHWGLARDLLTAAQQGPTLILVAGLPGAGKSTLARHLAGSLGARIFSTDRIRKELAGLDPHEDAQAAFGEGIYTEEWTTRTYEECLDRARRELAAGGRVIIDANLRREAQRRPFLEMAHNLGGDCALLVCQTSEDRARARIESRHDDPSDADWQVFLKAREQWERPEGEPCGRVHFLPDASIDVVTQAALGALEPSEEETSRPPQTRSYTGSFEKIERPKTNPGLNLQTWSEVEEDR